MRRKRKGQNMDHVIADVVKASLRTNTQKVYPSEAVVMKAVTLPTPVGDRQPAGRMTTV